MILHQVIHKESGQTLGHRVEVATSMTRRTVGLMFRKDMGPIDGLIIESCNSVHSCFMRFPLDVIFLSKENKVVKIVRSMKAWRFTLLYFKAVRVFELEAGKLPLTITEGSSLEVKRV